MKAFLIFLLTPVLCLAFVDWETTSISVSSNLFEITQPGHDSCAGSDGTVYVAFVRRSGDQDSLYFTSKNLYANPSSGPVIVRTPIKIDSADSIDAIQIKYDEDTGRVHFAYSVKGGVPIGQVMIPFTAVRHAVYQVGGASMPAVNTVRSQAAANSHHQLSLGLREKEGVDSLPAIAIYTPTSTGGTLSFAEKNANATWEVTPLTSDGDSGAGCDLYLGASSGTVIVFEDRTNNQILTAVLSSGDLLNQWSFKTVAIGPAGGRVSQPSIGNSNVGVVYLRREGRTSSLMLAYRNFSGNYGHEVVDSVTTPIGQIFAASIEGLQIVNPPPRVRSLAGTNPDFRTVISYSKSFPENVTLTQPWVAVRSSAAPGFIKTPLPLISGSEVHATGSTVLSLDDYDYPMITWDRKAGGSLHASYCPDWTDRDGDGVVYLQEKAFRMDSDVADAEKLPSPVVLKNAEGDCSLSLIFPVSGYGSVDARNQNLLTDQFEYEAELSMNLQDWFRDPAEIVSQVSTTPPPFPPFEPVGAFRINTILGTSSVPRQFLRVKVFRR